MIVLRSNDEIQIMRQAGAIVAEVLLKLKEWVHPGVTTGELDRMASEWITKAGGQATFLGYRGYPKTLCTSLNEEIVHGIPGHRVLQAGDILSVDCGVTFNSYIADAARTYPVGEISAEKENLLLVTEQALHAGIEAYREGNRLGDVGHAIEQKAKAAGYGVVQDFVGHGVGQKLHEEPQVPNFGNPGTGPRIKRGMVVAIEPMFNLGTYRTEVLKDGWTVVTKDRKPSAHFEHTVVVTEKGTEILTKV